MTSDPGGGSYTLVERPARPRSLESAYNAAPGRCQGLSRAGAVSIDTTLVALHSTCSAATHGPPMGSPFPAWRLGGTAAPSELPGFGNTSSPSPLLSRGQLCSLRPSPSRSRSLLKPPGDVEDRIGR